jgi:hypothetical protein
MASESEPENGPASEQLAAPASKAAPSDRPKKKKAKRPRPPIPRTEQEIDSPTKQTVGMLGILCIMTIIMWAFARGACNYHPPKETRVPRKVTLLDLAHDPKNAAIELQQRWLTRDFDGALELATGNVAQQIKDDKAACNAACLSKRPALEKTVLTSATISDANPLGATARVTSVGLPEGTKTYLLHMDRSDQIWKAIDRQPDAGGAYVPPTTLPPTAESAPPAVSAVSAAPAVSGAPAISGAPAASGAPVKMIHRLPVAVPTPAASN